MKYDLADKTVLVTGASGGLGKEFSYQLVRSGARVVGVARREEELQKIKKDLGDSFNFYVADLLNLDSIGEITKTIVAAHRPEVLVNNAGVFAMDYLPKMDPQGIKRMIDLNVTAPILLYQAWLNAAIDVDGHTPELAVWVSSVSGLYSYGGNSPYSASKFAVRGFALDQRAEWNTMQSTGPIPNVPWEDAEVFTGLNLRQLVLVIDSTDTEIIHRTHGNSYAKTDSYDYLNTRIVVDGVLKTMVGDGEFADSVVVEFGIRELSEGKKQCAIKYPVSDDGIEDRLNATIIPLADFIK